MLHNTNRRVEEYGRRHRFQSRWWRVLAAMACVVVFCTTYALILPAATLSQDTVCGLEEHTHSDECYAQELICTDESEEHEHSDACYVSVLTCGLEEHQHSDDCYADDEEISEQSEEAATEAAGESATEAGTADTETGKDSEGSGEGLTEDAEVDGSKDSAKGTEDSGEGLTEGSENSGEGLTENAEIDGTENAAEGLTEDGAVDGENAENSEETEELTLTEQTVEATVYADDSYTDLFDQEANITVKGDLPENVRVKAYPVSVALDDGTAVIEAYDITLFIPVENDETGEIVEEAYEPEQAVEVNISSNRLKDLETVSIYHIPDDPDAIPEKVQDELHVNDGEIAFDAESFSIYVVAGKDNISTVSITGDTTVQVNSTITLSCDSSNCNYGSWTSSNDSIATVSTSRYSSSRATVTGVKTGNVTITHTHYVWSNWSWNQVTETINITVTGQRFNNEYAQIYALKTPTSTPRSNDTSQWTNYHNGWNATINVTGGEWVDNNKNILVYQGDQYIVQWPDGSTEQTWTLTRDDSKTGSYFTTLLDDIWDAYKNKIASDLKINDLQKSDVLSITLNPYKISKNNGTSPDKHVDCEISVECKGVYTAKFNVKEVGSSGYETMYSKNYKSTDRVQEYTYRDSNGTTYAIGSTKVVAGKTYVLKGWYTENDAGAARSDSIAEFPYTPSNKELGDGAVNFYAEWVLATNDVTIVKYDENDKDTLISGAAFQLTDGTTTKVGTTGDNGTVIIDDVPYGNYTLTEISAPSGYKKITGSVTVVVGKTISIGSNDIGAEMKDGKLYVPNEPNEVQVKKYDGSDDEPLANVTFTLTGPEGFTTQTKVTGDDGMASFNKLPNGSYELTESGNPTGYNSLTGSIKFTVADGTVTEITQNDVGAKLENGVVWVPNYKLATISVKKVDGENSSITLAGAEFTLQNKDGKYYKITDGIVSWEDNAVALQTGDDGNISFTNIPDGTYTLKESKEPSHYIGIKDSITVEVKNGVVTYKPGTSGASESDGVLYVPNTKATVDVTIAKKDINKNPLTGAKFYLYYTENGTNYYYVESGNWSTDAASKATITPDGANAETVVEKLTVGTTYYLVETEAPAGYQLLTEAVTITPISTSALTVNGGGASADGLTVSVPNQTGETLPNTGGPGTTMYTLSGLMLMAIAAAGCLMYRGRMSGKGGAR